MCFGDLMIELHRRGISVTESQVRWALKTGKVSRPKLDASLRFTFSPKNVGEIADHFRKQQTVTS
jgi:hypothetical protein